MSLLGICCISRTALKPILCVRAFVCVIIFFLYSVKNSDYEGTLKYQTFFWTFSISNNGQNQHNATAVGSVMNQNLQRFKSQFEKEKDRRRRKLRMNEWMGG